MSYDFIDSLKSHKEVSDMERVQRKRYRTDREIREEINRLLGGSLKEGEWSLLVKEHYIDEILQGEEVSCIEAAKKVREWRQATGSSKIGQKDKVDMLSEEEVQTESNPSVALSVLVAQEAAQDAEVQKFRTEVLANRLLPMEEVERWVQEQAHAGGPPTKWVGNIPLPSRYEEIMVKLILGIRPDTPLLTLELPTSQMMGRVSMQVQALKYGAPDGWARSIPTALGGILEHLRQLSDRLAERYKWTEAQASLFVLTGQIPLISSIYMTLAIHSRPLFSRIVLEIDPASSPSKVAEAYRRGRKEILAARHRNLSEKHLQLALFAAQRPRNETGALKMAEWNKTHPIEWQYKEVANFSHDCLQARRRLLRE